MIDIVETDVGYEIELSGSDLENVETIARDRGKSVPQVIADLFGDAAAKYGLWRPGTESNPVQCFYSDKRN